MLIDKLDRNSCFLQDIIRSNTRAQQDLRRSNGAGAQYNLLSCVDTRSRAIRFRGKFRTGANELTGARFGSFREDNPRTERPEENGEIRALSDGLTEVGGGGGAPCKRASQSFQHGEEHQFHLSTAYILDIRSLRWPLGSMKDIIWQTPPAPLGVLTSLVQVRSVRANSGQS